MRIYTKTVSMWDESRQRYVTDEAESEWYEYEGPVALCKGDDTAKAAEQQQMNFNSQLMAIFQQQFAKQSAVLDFLKGKLQPMIDKPTGYSPEALTTMRTSATDTLSDAYQNAQRALQNKEFTQGGRDLPSGINDQIDAALLTAEAKDKANAQNTITLNDENLKQSNYWNAMNVLSGNVASQFNPLGYAGAATSGSNAVAGLSQAVTNSQQTGLGALFGGLAGGVFGAAGQAGGFGKLFCWIAARLYGGWDNPRTQLVRWYLLTDFGKKWYGAPVVALYAQIGQWASKRDMLVKMVEPLFGLALAQAKKKKWMAQWQLAGV